MPTALVLSYAACGTCKKALAWLKAAGVDTALRSIVDLPPTRAELLRWVPQSQKPLRAWLNTSGQSYRALGKARIDAMSEDEILTALSQDGKLVRRPVVVSGDRVLLGFVERDFEAAFR